MEWHDEGLEGEEDGLKAWAMVHQAPDQAGGRGQAPAAAATRELRLAAFPPLFKGEPEEGQLARADAAAACWDALAANIQDTLEDRDAGTFQALLDFARQSHRPPGSDACPELSAGCQRIPTGLVLAGGVNSADHGRTFPSLADFLRQQGCYVALLKPEHFSRGPGETIGEVLCQFSGLADSRAEHFAALAAWYADEAGSGDELAQQAQQTAQQEQQEQQAEQPAAGSQEGGKAERRTLRQRPARSEQAVEAALAAEQAANRQRPLVVIVEGTEGVDLLCLRDFILVASESHSEVPLTLALGLTTTASALLSLLPSEITDRCMALRNFRLATGIERLDTLVLNVLLGGSGRWPGLLFSPGIIGGLIDAFLNHYYSTGVIAQGLRVAALEHFRTVPASVLAAAALEGPDALEEVLEGLNTATLSELKKALGGRSASQLAHAVHNAQAAWSRWAVGLQWLVLAAEELGLQSIEFRPWKLLEEALRPGFAGEPLKQLLGQIEKVLRRDGKHSAGAVRQLAAALRQRAEQVWGGAEAAAEQLADLAAVEAGAAEDGREGDDQQAQQHAQQQAQQAEQEDEEEQAAEAPATKKQKRDVYHSKVSRKAALLAKAVAQTAKKQGGAKAAAAAKARQAAAPGDRLAAWLAPALRTLLAEPPTKLPGAAVFTCKDTAALDCLTAEPRAALHLALTEPHQFLRELPQDLGLAPGQEDASLAYRLFDQDPACTNLADWYETYAAVYAAGPDSTGKKRKAATKGGKGKGKGKGKAGVGDEEAAAGGSGGSAGAGSAAAALQRELAARFSQATADLQYVGLIKPAKRRRGDFVQRMVHMPAAGL